MPWSARRWAACSALRAIVARALVLAPPLDILTPAPAARGAAACIAAARFVEIPSPLGHLATTSTPAADADFLNREIGEFLA